MATIQDVAKLANVSVATVSRVINNTTYVSPEARQEVNNAIKQLNYQPNLTARNLRRLETKTILVLLPTISNTFYSKVIKGIEDTAYKNGYTVMICTTASNKQIENRYLNLLKNKLVDGIIFMTSQLEEDELGLIAQNLPIIQCGEYKENVPASYISIDNEAAGYMAVNHLIKRGHCKIGMVTCRNNHISTKKRELGYKKALNEAGIEYKSDLIKYGNYGFGSGMKLAKEFLKIKPRPTAIFAISDMMAIGLVRYFLDKGLKVPEDIAVVGFDNIRFSYMVKPKITTISQPQYKMGSLAMELLLRKIQDKQSNPQNVFMEHKLIVRESS